MTTFTTDSGIGSKYFGTTIPSMKDRVELWAKANGLPTEHVEEAFNTLQADGSEYKLFEDYIRTDNGTQMRHIYLARRVKGRNIDTLKMDHNVYVKYLKNFAPNIKIMTSWFMVALTLLMAWSDIALENHGN